ncbi:hypothetical protein JAAARDRAFT_30477 [Jaapia argillacea MUCL 33604]|uniref:Fcf2 pre-rRNA processing C-terminal domain-containing protein n=1 Tax=Jaapia argillacea MUCL 33604 TaxID=933084 RepID=A0A067QIY3_9AGAM|nr:hypothetical protein JAAARDRAFT_30477 [Jaapia argillacea MUCL 33604]
MALTTRDKGKGRALPEPEPEDYSGSSSSSGSSSDSDSDSDFDPSPEYLESLLEKARQNVQSAKQAKQAEQANDHEGEEDVIVLEGEEELPSLPPLDPGVLPPSYFSVSPASTLKSKAKSNPLKLNDPDVSVTQKAAEGLAVPAPPLRPEEVGKDGKVLTKKEKKALRTQTAGSKWFDLPAPPPSSLPSLYTQIESLRLRNRLDPKRFYRKDEGESKGIKGLPKYFAIGTIVDTPGPFANNGAERTEGGGGGRKRTLVDELVDDAEAKSYAKKKFRELQGVREGRGRGATLARRGRGRGKW